MEPMHLVALGIGIGFGIPTMLALFQCYKAFKKERDARARDEERV